jgi:Na+-driven multidrug efflux pump
VLGLLLSRPLLVVMGVPEMLMADALVYFNIRFLSTLFTICSAFETNIMIAHGDTRRITLFSGISGFVNVVLNYVFLRVIPLGVAGVALATLISELLHFVCKTRLLFSANGEYQLRFDRLRLHKDHARQILAIGIPNGLSNSMFSFSNMLLQSTVNSFGPVYITANSCADSVADIVSTAYTGFPSACLAAVSQCHGARDYPRIRQVIRRSFVVIESLIVILGIVVMVFARQILGLFTSTPAVVDAALPKVFFYLTGYLIHTFMQVYMAGLKGLKRSGKSFAINAIGVCIPRVLWVMFVMPVFPNPSILYAIYPISWLIASVPMGIAFHRTYRKLAADNENLNMESEKIS